MQARLYVAHILVIRYRSFDSAILDPTFTSQKDKACRIGCEKSSQCGQKRVRHFNETGHLVKMGVKAFKQKSKFQEKWSARFQA